MTQNLFLFYFDSLLRSSASSAVKTPQYALSLPTHPALAAVRAGGFAGLGIAAEGGEGVFAEEFAVVGGKLPHVPEALGVDGGIGPSIDHSLPAILLASSAKSFLAS